MSQTIIAIICLVGVVLIFRRHLRRVAASRPVQWEKQVILDANSDPSLAVDADDSAETRGDQPLDFGEINRAFRIGDMHFTRSNFAEAEKWFIKVLALNENHKEALNQLGVIYMQNGNNRRAEILYRKLFSITQKEPTYYCNYGRCLYNQKRYTEAIEAYENAIKLDYAKPSRYISIGQIYYELKNLTKALHYFNKALEFEPKNLEFLWIVAEVAKQMGDLGRSHKYLKKILDIDPYNQEAKNKIAESGIPMEEEEKETVIGTEKVI